MADATKYQLVPNANIVNDFRSHFSFFRTRKSSAFVYGVVFVFIAFSVFLAFSPSSSASSPSTWFINIFTLNNTSPPLLYDDEFNRSPPFSHDLSSNSTQIHDDNNDTRSHEFDTFQTPISDYSQNLTQQSQLPPDKFDSDNTTKVITPENPSSNQTSDISPQVPSSNQSSDISAQISPKISPISSNDTKFGSSQQKTNQSIPQISPEVSPPNKDENLNSNNGTQKQSDSNQTSSISPQTSPIPANSTEAGSGDEVVGAKKNDTTSNIKTKKKGMVDSLVGCDLYDGSWVEDDSYPLYKPGSCKLVDEQFNCILNGRPDTNFQKLRWKPKGCTLPRLKGRQILKLLKGKRLVFVGDSLNRNMWESLVCILKGAAKNPKNVFEAYGRHSFRTEASYSFVFKDYNFTIEFFVAPFLVQQWDFKDKNGATKETLRLDLMVRDSDHFQYADVVVFNTGHWWTHEKTSKGEDYYQEGSHVYQQLDVKEAFRKAITTWGRWIDANIDPKKTHVFFRGYSSTHFSGGQWNSGGQCDSETEPIRNESYLTKYPWKMKTLEQVLMGMKTPVSYLNITKLTDYRKDGHPSVYRKQRPSTEEKRAPLKYQDCSHWCLPGVPDSWNELLFAEMLRKHFLDNQTSE